MNPGADRGGADINQAGGFTDVEDSVVVLRLDAVDRAEFHSEMPLSAGLAGRLVPGLDLAVGGEDLAGVEEIGRPELPDGPDVAAGDPAAHRRLRHAKQLSHIPSRDLGHGAQVYAFVELVRSGRPRRDWPRPGAAPEPRPCRGTLRRRRRSWKRVARRKLEWSESPRLCLDRFRALGKVAIDDGLRDLTGVRDNPLAICAQTKDDVFRRMAKCSSQLVYPHGLTVTV